MAMALQVDDRQAAVGEADAGVAIDPIALVVGAAMRDSVGHPLQQRRIDPTRAQKAGNPTHAWRIPLNADRPD